MITNFKKKFKKNFWGKNFGEKAIHFRPAQKIKNAKKRIRYEL